MHKGNNIAALVLAGGYSSRAQAFKPLLPLGDATIIERSISNFNRAGVNNISVVIGHRADELRSALIHLNVDCVFNPRYDEGMFSSVVTGLQALRQGTEAFFLLPADIPLVKSHTIRLLYRAFRRTKADVVYPVFQGRRGHPPLISAKLIPEILAGHPIGGLRSILERHAVKACDVEIIDEGILLDADTPADYREITQRYCTRDIPSSAECTAIFHRMGIQDRVITHGEVVALTARKLALPLRGAGVPLDINLVIVASKLHDIAKGCPNHAQYGARMLKQLGYPKVARIIAVHHDISYRAGTSPDEAAIVYLADKLVKNDRPVTIEERFVEVTKKYIADPEAARVINKRRTAAESIKQMVEHIAGADLSELITYEYSNP
jgi:CTP:molybdopterin cytidylyltransferase MocA/HD superfamily phosphodiesterase